MCVRITFPSLPLATIPRTILPVPISKPPVFHPLSEKLYYQKETVDENIREGERRAERERESRSGEQKCSGKIPRCKYESRLVTTRGLTTRRERERARAVITSARTDMSNYALTFSANVFFAERGAHQLARTRSSIHGELRRAITLRRIATSTRDTH